MLNAFSQLRTMVLPDRHIDHGSPEHKIEVAGLSSNHILATMLSLLGRQKKALTLK